MNRNIFTLKSAALAATLVCVLSASAQRYGNMGGGMGGNMMGGGMGGNMMGGGMGGGFGGGQQRFLITSTPVALRSGMSITSVAQPAAMRRAPTLGELRRALRLYKRRN